MSFTLKEIKMILGGDISTKNTKMPGTSFGLSTAYCDVGGTLRDIEGSVCSQCYAERLEKFRPSVKKGWENRTKAVREACLDGEGQYVWVQAMAQRLKKLAPTHHRWHDSGDLQSDRHLSMIMRVATLCPEIQFWLPTKERAIVKRARKALGNDGIPPNLCIRESAAMQNDRLNTPHPNSMVINGEAPEGVWICPAPLQENSCGDCRACWDNKLLTVAYIKH